MNNKKPSAGTVARLICLVLSTLNQVVLMKTGKSFLPVESKELEDALSTVFFVASAGWSYWKNNSWTKEAIEADDTLHLMKKNKRT